MRTAIKFVILLTLMYQLPSAAQTLNENLSVLEPLLNQKWGGELKSPDGSASWETIHEYKMLWDGTIVKFTGCTPERNSNSEGYFYWDRGEQKVAMLIVNEKGIYQKGFVTVEEGIITIKGTISFPEKTFDFKNTFEFTGEGKMTDRWFQNAFGPWMPGHVIEFTAK